MQVQRNKAIVGQNAFAHEAGIHQHGMLQERTTYEIMRPQDVGFSGTNLVLGKHSGRHAFRDRIDSMGYKLDDDHFEKVFADFIALADKKKDVYDADIAALIENRIGDTGDAWKMISLHTSAGTGTIPTATLELQYKTRTATRRGDWRRTDRRGLRALERIIGISARLQDYQVRSISVGKDAQGEVTVEIESGGRTYFGKGFSTDIIEASAPAYLKALNKAVAGAGQPHPGTARSGVSHSGIREGEAPAEPRMTATDSRQAAKWVAAIAE